MKYKMKISVIGVMRSHLDKENIVICNDTMPELLVGLKRFAGAEAGICYMSKPYFDSYVSDSIKALNRFETVSKTGHHSIAGHSQIAVLFEGIPKILAMFLNNLSDYETSEKSGRYTIMTGNSEKETEIYEKWCEKLQKVIFDTYGSKIDVRTCDKLAKENARYFLSVFTPTTMGYTTSLRQFNYIIDWCDRYCSFETPENYFYMELKHWFKLIGEQLKDLLYVNELRDIKNRQGLDFISVDERNDTEIQLGKLYNIGYMGSFAQVAQAQRHRTLFYNIQFDGISKDFYVPSIIRDTEFENEWLDDFEKVKEFIPNGTKVFIEECGKIENFYLKSMERNCGRAQLEIMKQNLDTSLYFYKNIEKFPIQIQEKIKKFYKSNGEPKMKGEILECKEPCVWGCLKAKRRKI